MNRLVVDIVCLENLIQKTFLSYNRSQIRLSISLIPSRCVVNKKYKGLYIRMIRKEIEFYNQRLHAAKELGNKAVEGAAYGSLGNAYRKLGDFKQAIEYHKESLLISFELGDKAGEARAYGNLGNAYHCLGDFKQAIEYQKQRLDIAKQLADKSGEGLAYGNLGIAYNTLGDFKKAIEYQKQALGIAKELEDKAGEARAYGNLGIAYDCLGDFKRAVEYHKERLSIAQQLDDKAGEGRAYGNLGNAFYSLGDFKQAIESHTQYLSIAKELGDKAGEGNAYCNLGNAYSSVGDFQQALKLHKGHLEIAKEVGDRVGEGGAYGNLGNAYEVLRDFQKAIEHHQKDLSIAKELGNRDREGRANDNLGNAYHSLGDFKQAAKYHMESLKIAKEVGDRAGEGAAYGNLGTVCQSRGKLEQTIEFFKKKLNIAKELGQRVQEGEACFSLGQALELHDASSDALDYYRLSVKLFNHSRALLLSQDVWKISFRNACHYSYTALWRVLLRLQRSEEALCVAEQGRGQALTDLMKLQYGSELLGIQTFENEETISDMLSHIYTHTVFVALASDTIHLWNVRKGKDIQFRQKKVEREDAVTFLECLRQNAFKEIRGAGQVRCENRSLDELRDDLPSSEETVQETGMTSSRSESNSLSLFYNCIVCPIADLLEGDELIIIPDGPLSLAPIAAFMDEESKYLSENIRIRILPSLMSLKLITDCPEDYHSKSGVLLVGDPYVKEVKRMRGKRVRLEQLPCAEEEVKTIGKILNTEPITGRDATKEEVLQRIGSVALVHIAAHGDMENGEIALAPNPTRPSKVPKDDDFLLKMSDIQAVQLRTKLVVLSCCHSAQGKVSAEGVVGIARAFLGAGARSVLVSLWAIDDEATMEFMKSFYQQLCRGDSASVALNRAMKCLRESEKFSAVKYWAPFVLMGDDVTIEFAEK